MPDIFINHTVLYSDGAPADELALYEICHGVLETTDYHTFGYAYSPADAHRFAASGKLLVALEAIYKWWTETQSFQNGDDDMPAALFDGMRDAIAKARRQQ